jgi:hypothetical protein
MLSYHFPAGWATPTKVPRAVVATLIAVGGMMLAYNGFHVQKHSDFGAVWFGAQAMLQHRNPYALIGHGLEFDHWPLLYPAPALVAAIPFAVFSERTATMIFVGISTFALAMGVTRSSWHLLPLFITEPYTSAARLGQWSILLTAALFFPIIAAFSVCKPQSAIPVLFATRRKTAFVATLAGGAALLLVSFILMPRWPEFCLANIRAATGMRAPITYRGGLLVLLALFRWRRPESWLILSMACMPQAWGWYGTLALLTIPATFAESVALAGAIAIGGWIGAVTMPPISSADSFFGWAGSLIVFSVYLPVTLIVLLRKNEGPYPLWLSTIALNGKTGAHVSGEMGA